MNMSAVDFLETAAGITAIVAAVVLATVLALYKFSTDAARRRRENRIAQIEASKHPSGQGFAQDAARTVRGARFEASGHSSGQGFAQDAARSVRGARFQASGHPSGQGFVRDVARSEYGARDGGVGWKRRFTARRTVDSDFRRDPKRFAREQRRRMTNSLRYDVMYRDGFRCQICGATAQDGAKLHVDHIVPVSRGGRTEMSNLRTLCARCNLGKGAKLELPIGQREPATLPYDPYDGDPYDTGEPYDANDPYDAGEPYDANDAYDAKPLRHR